MATSTPTEKPIEISLSFWRAAKPAFEEKYGAAAVPTEVSQSATKVKLLASAPQIAQIVELAGALSQLRSSKGVVKTLGKRMGDAKNQAKFRSRRHDLGQREVRGIWADPKRHAAIKSAAAPHVGPDGWVASAERTGKRAGPVASPSPNTKSAKTSRGK